MNYEDPEKIEARRIILEYSRRESEIDRELHSPWQPGEILMTSERKRVAAYQLRKLGKFPIAGQKCMEIGHGGLGWLADLITWGVRE